MQQLPEQATVSVPFAAAVERDNQEVALSKLLKRSAGSCSADDRITEPAAHAVEDRRAGEEGNLGVGHPVQELRTEGVADEPVVTGDREPGVCPGLLGRIASAAR